jgi:hypothetical protein
MSISSSTDENEYQPRENETDDGGCDGDSDDCAGG